MLKEAPSVSFQDALQEFSAKSAATTHAKLNHELFQSWKEIYWARQRMLDELLEQRGLAICSSTSHPSPELWLKVHSSDRYGHVTGVNERVKDLTPEDLGIFPKPELRFLFKRFTSIAHHGHPSLERYEQFEELELLCSAHFPASKDTNRSWESKADDRYKTGDDMYTEAIEKDGKLLTIVRDIDVSKVLVERPYLGSEMYYKYLGLPEIPKIPQWIDFPAAPPDYRYAKGH